MHKFWEWIKKWGLAIIGFVAGLLLLSQKPKWVKEKEREIKNRDKEISKVQDAAKETQSDYEEAKAKHDEDIEQALQAEGRPSFTDPDSAASSIDDILRRR